MPYRALLYNHKGGAPKRDPNQQAPSLESARFFSLDDMYRNQWSENQGDLAGMQQNQSPKHLESSYHHHHHHQYFDQQNVLNQSNYPVYRNDHPTEYSSDVMDTDVSSISYSSISSTPCGDMMVEEDAQSSYFMSRKASVNSSLMGSEPSPTEPYIRFDSRQEVKVLPYEPQGIPPQVPNTQAASMTAKYDNFMLRSSPANAAAGHQLNLVMPKSSPQGRRQPQSTAQTASAPRSRKSTPKTPESQDEKAHSRDHSLNSKTSTCALKDDPKHAKKVRAARQAHSLVERKYRENLNARIVDLHKMLKTAQNRRSSQAEADTEDKEPEDGDEQVLKFKKSDVLVEAITYVQTTERERREQEEEIENLKEKIKLMEHWIRHGGVGQG